MKEKIGGVSEDEILEAIPIDENYENKEYYTIDQAIDKIIDDYTEQIQEVILNEDTNGSKQVLRRTGKSGSYGEGLILLENGAPQKFIKVLYRPTHLVDKKGKQIYGAENGYYQANHAHYLVAKNYFDKNKDFLKEKVLFPEEFDHLENLLKKLEEMDKGAESYHTTDDREYIKQVTFINYLYNYVDNYKHRVEAMGETEKNIKLEFPFPKFHAAFTTEGGKVCTTMDMVRGETLDDSRKNFDSPEKKRKYFDSLINKVHLLHKFNFTHSDLKPDNVMASDQIFLIDNGFVEQRKDDKIEYMVREWRTTALLALHTFSDVYLNFNVMNRTRGLAHEDIEKEEIPLKYKTMTSEMGLSKEQLNFLLFLASDKYVQYTIMFDSDDYTLADDYSDMEKISSTLKIQELEKFVMNGLEMEDLEGLDKEKIDLYEKIKKGINKGLSKYLKSREPEDEFKDFANF